MTGQEHEIILNKNYPAYFRISAKLCRKCNLGFEIGDIILAKPGRLGRWKYYHKTCWGKLLH